MENKSRFIRKFRVGDNVRMVYTDNEGTIKDIYFSSSGDYVYEVVFFSMVSLFLDEEMLESLNSPAEYMS